MEVVGRGGRGRGNEVVEVEGGVVVVVVVG